LPIIQVSDLSYAYPPAQKEDAPSWVLRGINLEIAEGEFAALMGPTGAGKTTLGMALNGIVPQATGGLIRGNVWAAGLNTKRHPVSELARRVGVVFQEPENQLFNRDVESEIAFGLENLGLPRKEMRERVRWALEAVGMAEFARRSPFELSGGQKQRVSLASILAMKPKVLVLDEPTARLDARGQSQLFSVLSALRHEMEMTILLISNDPEWVRALADRVLIMQSGTLVLQGDPRRVLGDVGRLGEIGLAAPQMAELASYLNGAGLGPFQFSDLEGASIALSEALANRAGGEL
jgi:energy-coupling factor transporter ATP-binding protein EcfA2